MRRDFLVRLFSLAIVAILIAACGAVPTPTPIPSPTKTPRPTFTPAPTRTPTPKFTFTPTVTNTPAVTATFTPKPTDTPKPTNTPRPTNTPAPRPPTATPAPPPPPTNTPVPPMPYISPGVQSHGPNCGTQFVDGKVYEPNSTNGRNGVRIQVWAFGIPQKVHISGERADKGAGAWIHIFDLTASRDIQFEVAVVDENGNLLSEKVSGRLTKNCNPANGEALNQVWVDFVATR